MNAISRLPASPLANAALAAARASESVAIANHSIRSFLFAELLAEHDGTTNDSDYDRELLFAACVMHDLGTGDKARGEQRFEVEGADLAAEILSAHGAAARDVDRVWEAIAFHSSPGIAERRGLLAYLTREGIGVDFGRRADIVMTHEHAIHLAFPRLEMARSLTDAIVQHAARSPAAAPRYSVPGELLRERSAEGITRMEIASSESVWGG
ncbi:HD domain-containing protein [Lacisediminihabitans sp.]|jgi:hypothetical protein|uniref:HD domain-containing protein n=1 Tax=Lacisediminihabitans sp. TaxID=2787631 RepID=UPI002F953EC9